MATIFDVAQSIVQLRPGLTKIELYKLCYFAQGWHSTWVGQPLFTQPMEAWKYGPVSPELRQHSRSTGNRIDSIDTGSSDNLGDYERELIANVVEFYEGVAAFGADGLSDQSHGPAWQNARGDLPPEAACSVVIQQTDIRKEFTQRMWGEDPKPDAPATLPPLSADELSRVRRQAEITHREVLRGLALI